MSKYSLLTGFLLFLGMSTVRAEDPPPWMVDMRNVAIRAERNVRIPLRDGVKLAADVFLPKDAGRYPVILEVTPYHKGSQLTFRDERKFWTEHGYVLMIVDERGRGDSEGRFDWMIHDIEDGYDIVEWAAAQPWSNGAVGMRGASFSGVNQWYAAKSHPPHLKCITPFATVARPFDELPYKGGAFQYQWGIEWINLTSDRSMQGPLDVNWSQMLDRRPLLTADEAGGRSLTFYREFLRHPTFDEYWRRWQLSADDYRGIGIPSLAFSGWFDDALGGTIHHFQQMKRLSLAADRQFLLIGPWTHQTLPDGGDGILQIGDLTFPPESSFDAKQLLLKFFDACLNSGPAFQQAAVRVFVTGSNRWADFDAFPPREARDRALYLHSGGRANTLAGDGRLAWSKPRRQPPDAFTYDPRHPVPSDVPGGKRGPATDRASLQQRDDVLVYTSDSLDSPLTVLGNVRLELQASSDVRDTDFTANLLDVHPDGHAVQVASRGILRARYRQGFDREVPLKPGEIVPMVLDLSAIGHTFLSGHRLRIDVSSSAFPAFDANLNTGNPVATDTSQPVVAHQKIYHDAVHASVLMLPVIPFEAAANH